MEPSGPVYIKLRLHRIMASLAAVLVPISYGINQCDTRTITLAVAHSIRHLQNRNFISADPGSSSTLLVAESANFPKLIFGSIIYFK